MMMIRSLIVLVALSQPLCEVVGRFGKLSPPLSALTDTLDFFFAEQIGFEGVHVDARIDTPCRSAIPASNRARPLYSA